MSYETLTLARDGAVATITVNRPAVMNALNRQTVDDLRRAVLEVRRDEAVRVLVITGAGEKAFVAGADIKELAEGVPLEARELAARGQHVFDLIEQLGKPSIAAINGFALGGGCELALSCTFRVAADTARMGLPETNLGIIPGYGGTQRLPRLVGRDKALDLILTGRMASADEALKIGLVTRVVPAAALADEVRAFAQVLAARAPVAVRLALDAVNRGLDMSFADACALEAALFGLVATTEDMKEGTRAFVEKRKAEFKGR
jgi:enoyl-CoA hydratase/carnithine racemase